MKSLQSTILTSFALLVLGSSYGQGLTSIDVASERLYMDGIASKEISALGSAYINETFMPSVIRRYKNQMFLSRYNAYNGELQVDLGNGKIIALDVNKDYELMFTSTNKIYRAVSYITEDGTSKRDFLVLVNETDDVAIFKKESIRYVDAVPAATSYQVDKPAKFERNDDEYYIQMDGSITHLPTKKKDFLKKFPKQSKELKDYLKDSKLDPRDETELIQIVNHISTL